MEPTAQSKTMKVSLENVLLVGNQTETFPEGVITPKTAKITLDNRLYILYIENTTSNATKFLFCCVRRIGGTENKNKAPGLPSWAGCRFWR